MEPPHDVHLTTGEHGETASVEGRRTPRWLVAALAVLFLLQAALWLSRPDGVLEQVLGVGMLASSVVYLGQLLLERAPCLVADDEGLRMRDALGRWTEVRWSDVTDLDLSGSGRGLLVTAPGAVRRSGRLLRRDVYRFQGHAALPSLKGATLDYLRHRHAEALGRPT
ncbi:hypothetical protein GC722_16665 [Auraticoccus sp. F435]|uniref:PH domain-containing protein n=1 Tax=Auraticoccus cholistanensis TaxID=2656650 RepID=A0A6A9V242_9ACTN|nr:hypothetical protein [Auraticoccus cholistanensis]